MTVWPMSSSQATVEWYSLSCGGGIFRICPGKRGAVSCTCFISPSRQRFNFQPHASGSNMGSNMVQLFAPSQFWLRQLGPCSSHPAHTIGALTVLARSDSNPSFTRQKPSIPMMYLDPQAHLSHLIGEKDASKMRQNTN